MKGSDKQKPVRQKYPDKKKMPPVARRQFLEAINLTIGGEPMAQLWQT
jgi:hypothetical protein